MTYISLLTSPSDFGQALRANRHVLGLSLQALAARMGCQRQTLADLEAGKNVGLHIVFSALAALDKGLVIADKRPELDRLAEIFNEPED